MFRLVLKLISNMKRRAAICIWGISISIMLMFSLVQVGELILVSYKKAILNVSNYDIYYKNLDKHTADEIHKKYQDQYSMTQTVYFAYHKENDAILHSIIGVEGEWKKLFMVSIMEGTEPGDGEDICIGNSFAADRGIKVGDRIRLNVEVANRQVEREFTVSGIVSDPPVYQRGSIMFVTMECVDLMLEDLNLAGDASPLSYVEYVLMAPDDLFDSEEMGKLNYDMIMTFGKEVFQNAVFNEAKTELRDKGGLYAGMRLIIWLITAFIALAMTVFIYYIIQLNFWGRKEQYGILRSIGCNAKTLGELIMDELLIYGTVGYGLGCAMGITLNLVFAKILVRIFVGLEIEEIWFSPSMLLYVLLLLVMALLGGYLFFMLSLKKMRPIDLMHVRDTKSRKKRFVSKNILMELIVNNSFRDGKTCRALIVTMTLAFMLVIILGNGFASISFDAKKTAMAFADLELSVIPDMDMLMGESRIASEDIKMLENSFQEVYYIGMYRDYAVCDENGDTIANVLVFSTNLMDKIIRFQHLKTQTQVIGSFRDELQGALKSVRLIGQDGNVIEMDIDAHVDYGLGNLVGEAIPGSGYVIMDETYARNLIGKEPNWVDIYLAGTDISRNELKSLLATDQYAIYDLDAFQGKLLSQVQSVLILIGYMMVAMLWLVVFMVTNIVQQNFEARRKEMGMMLAVGVARRKIKWLLCGEIYVVIGIACLIASLGSFPVSMYVYYVVNQKVGMGCWGYLLGIPLTLGLCGSIVYANISKCLNRKVLELIREEE